MTPIGDRSDFSSSGDSASSATSLVCRLIITVDSDCNAVVVTSVISNVKVIGRVHLL